MGSLRQPCCGLFACTATSRSGARESHFISTEREDSGLEATFIGTTTTTTTWAPAVEEDPESPLPLVLTVLALLLALILAIAILCCCLSCNRRRRTKERRRKALTAKLAQERGRATLRSTLAKGLAADHSSQSRQGELQTQNCLHSQVKLLLASHNLNMSRNKHCQSQKKK